MSRLMFALLNQGFGWEKLSGQSFVINWQKPGKDACDLSSWILMEGAFKNYQKQHVQDWFFAHARPSWMGVSFMDWSRYSNTAWSSSAVAGRGGFQSFSWDGSNILLPCFVCESFTLFEAFEAATNPAEKSDILRQILTLPNTFLFLLILDLHPRLGVFWFDHRISECLRRLRSSFCFFFVIMRFGDHFRTWRLVRRYGLSCLGGRACMGGPWQYTCKKPACLLDCRTLSAYGLWMSCIMWHLSTQACQMCLGGNSFLYRYRRWYRGFYLNKNQDQAAVWCVFRVKLDFCQIPVQVFPSQSYYIMERNLRVTHPLKMVKISHWFTPGFHTTVRVVVPSLSSEVGAFEVNNGLFAAKPRCPNEREGFASHLKGLGKMDGWWMDGYLNGEVKVWTVQFFFCFFWWLMMIWWWFDDVLLYYAVSADLNNRHPLVAFFCEHVAKPWPEWGQESTWRMPKFAAFLLKLLGFHRFQHQHWWSPTWPWMLQNKKRPWVLDEFSRMMSNLVKQLHTNYKGCSAAWCYRLLALPMFFDNDLWKGLACWAWSLQPKERRPPKKLWFENEIYSQI